MASEPANSPGGSSLPDLRGTGAFLAAVGLTLTEITGSKVRGHADLGQGHHTPWGVVHGGVYTTIIESAASVGASAAVLEQRQFAVGVNNNTDFIRSVQEGAVEVVAEPVTQGRVQQLWQVIITRASDGKQVARGTVRLQNLPLPHRE
ncbi:MAG TPA: PaaI family thioesterase [Streptosporangiaceae bacterium]|jgi:1,4-dihydroxy-2-naphthoyl-CoA hydrolase